MKHELVSPTIGRELRDLRRRLWELERRAFPTIPKPQAAAASPAHVWCSADASGVYVAAGTVETIRSLDVVIPDDWTDPRVAIMASGWVEQADAEDVLATFSIEVDLTCRVKADLALAAAAAPGALRLPWHLSTAVSVTAGTTVTVETEWANTAAVTQQYIPANWLTVIVGVASPDDAGSCDPTCPSPGS